MRRAIFIFCVTGVLLCACGKRNEGERAARVAKLDYELLLKGKYEDFVDATYRASAIPDGYRSQLVLAAQMFMEREQNVHQGIKEIRAVSGEVHSGDTTATAFLLFCYGDSTQEQVGFPMVKHGDNWYLK